MQRAEHLLGERGRDRGLRLAAFLQQRGQAAVVGIGEQAEAVEQQLEAAEHRPAGDASQAPQRESRASPRSRRAAHRRRAGRRPLSRRSTEHAGIDAGFAQQPLETLMRASPPSRRASPRASGSTPGGSMRTSSCQGRSAVGPSSVHRPGRAERRAVLGQADVEARRAAAGRRGCRRRCRASQPRTLAQERPGIGAAPAALWIARSMSSATSRAVGLRLAALARGRGPSAATGRDDQTDRLHVVQPFEVGIALGLGRHGAQPVAGQR